MVGLEWPLESLWKCQTFICKSILILLQCNYNWVLNFSEINGTPMKQWRNGCLALWNTIAYSNEKLWDMKWKWLAVFNLSLARVFLKKEWNARVCSRTRVHTHGSRSLILAPGLDHVSRSCPPTRPSCVWLEAVFWVTNEIISTDSPWLFGRKPIKKHFNNTISHKWN